MRIGRPLCFFVLALILALPHGWLASAPAPLPKRNKVTPPRSLRQAFQRIQIGMTDDELFALMAPYKRKPTRHYQWQRWTDGQATVSVTIWPGKTPESVLSGDTFRVQDKEIQINQEAHHAK